MSIATRLQPAPALTLVRPHRPKPRWTAAEDQIMRATYGQHTAATLAAGLGRSVDGVRWRARTLGLATGHYRTPQEEIARLQAEIARLKRGALDAAHAPTADARRLATLFAYRLSVIDAETAATVLGVPVARLPVEVGKAAAMGLDVARMALGERA